MKKFLFPLSFIFLLFLSSCRDEKNSTASNNSNVSSSKFETKEFIDKYNKYIAFGNLFDKSVINSYDRYFDWADREKGPSSQTKNVRGVSTLSERQITQLEQAVTSKPEIENVDEKMKPVIKSSKALFEILNEADSYYQKQDYKDDDFSKGKELHTKIVTAYDNYFKNYDAMYADFKVVQNNLKEFEANKFKENGEFIRYNLIMELNKIDQIFSLIGNLDGEALKSINIETLKSTVSEFRKVHEELEKYNKDENQKTKEFGKTGIAKTFLPSYIREGNSFVRECRNLIERIEKNDFDYGISHPMIAAKGSPLKLRKVYSQLVTNYNRMN